MSATPVSGSGRETRILLLVIVVAVAMLLVLAQFRYPGPERAGAVPPVGPIERLAARATFEELALIMADLSERVQDALIVVTLDRVEPNPPDRRFVVALRTGASEALVYVPEGYQVAAQAAASVVREDAVRRLALLRVATTSFADFGSVASAVGGPGYLAVFEGSRGGPAVRPVFVDRLDSFDDPHWSVPLLAVGGDPQLRPGALIYTLDGRLVGMAVPDGSSVAVSRVAALMAAMEALRSQ